MSDDADAICRAHSVRDVDASGSSSQRAPKTSMPAGSSSRSKGASFSGVMFSPMKGVEGRVLHKTEDEIVLDRLKERYIDLDAKRMKLSEAHQVRHAQINRRQRQHDDARCTAYDVHQMLKDLQIQTAISVDDSESEDDSGMKLELPTWKIRKRLHFLEQLLRGLEEENSVQDSEGRQGQSQSSSGTVKLQAREDACKQKEESLSHREAAMKMAEARLETKVASMEAEMAKLSMEKSHFEESRKEEARREEELNRRDYRIKEKEASMIARKRMFIREVKRLEAEKKSLQAWEDDLKKRNDTLMIAEEDVKQKQEQYRKSSDALIVKTTSLESRERTLQRREEQSHQSLQSISSASPCVGCNDRRRQDVSTTSIKRNEYEVFKDCSIQTDAISIDAIDRYRHQDKVSRSRARRLAARSSLYQQVVEAKRAYLSTLSLLDSAREIPRADKMIVDSAAPPTHSTPSLHLGSHLDSFHLRETHLWRLEPNEKINSPIVDFAAAHYLLDYQSKFHLDHSHRTFTYIETSMWDHIYDAASDSTTTDATTKRLRLQPVLDKYPGLFDRDDLIILPCIETHYFFVVIRNIRYYIYHVLEKEELIRKMTRLAQKSARDFKRELAYDCCILISDSLCHKPAATTNHRIIAEALEGFLIFAAQQQCATPYGPYITTGLKVTWQSVVVPTQKDKNDCGPCALRYCKQYLSNIDHCIEEVIPMARRDDEFFRPSTMIDARMEVKSLVDTVLNPTPKERLYDSRLPSNKLSWRGLARAGRLQGLRTLTSCKRKRDCVSLDAPKDVASMQMHSRESIIPSSEFARSRQKRCRFKRARSTALASRTPVMAIETEKKAHRMKSKAKQIVEVVID